MSSSFFGGHRGASFILVKSYDTVDLLKEDFNSSTCTVAMGEYASVSNTGDIFRRVPYASSQAQKVGTLKIDSGNVANSDVQLNTVEAIEQMPNHNIFTVDFDNSVFTPGADIIDGAYQPKTSVEWATCRDNNGGVIYMGFKFPYTVFNFSTEFTTNPEEIGIKNKSNAPFFQNLVLTLPEIHDGTSFSDLQVIVASNDDNVEFYEGQTQDRLNAQPILVYSVTVNEVTTKHFLGRYNSIERISLENGQLKIKYYSKTEEVLGTIKYVTDVIINEQEGKIITNYSNGNSTEKAFVYVKSVDFTVKDGKRYIQFTNSKNEITEKLFDYPTRIYFDENSSKFMAEFNADKSDVREISTKINSTKQTAITSDYHYVVNYSDTTKNVPEYNGTDTQYAGWADLGYVKDNSGLLIGTRFLSTQAGFDTETHVIETLTTRFPEGITGQAEGKAVAVVDRANLSSTIYCFDYRNNVWFLLGNTAGMGGSGGGSVLVGNIFDYEEAFIDASEGTIWFVTELEGS